MKEKTEAGLIEYTYLETVEKFEFIWDANELPTILYLAYQVALSFLLWPVRRSSRCLVTSPEGFG